MKASEIVDKFKNILLASEVEEAPAEEAVEEQVELSEDLKEVEVEAAEEVKADEFNCIPVRIRCKGELAQIFKLYRQFQTLDRLIRIEQVRLSNDNDFNGQVSMETKAIIYYRAKVG